MSFNGIAPAAVPVVIANITFVTVSFLVVCIRMFTRWRMLNNVGPDDYLMAGALVSKQFYHLKRGCEKKRMQHIVSFVDITSRLIGSDKTY